MQDIKMVLSMVETEIQLLLMPERFKTCNNCIAKGQKKLDCWQKDESAYKHPKNWKLKDTRTEVNARNMEQLLICGES